jgi:hypothetical protein
VIIWRAAFFADDVLAMKRSLLLFENASAIQKGQAGLRVKKNLIGPDVVRPGTVCRGYSRPRIIGQ